MQLWIPGRPYAGCEEERNSSAIFFDLSWIVAQPGWLLVMALIYEVLKQEDRQLGLSAAPLANTLRGLTIVQGDGVTVHVARQESHR